MTVDFCLNALAEVDPGSRVLQMNLIVADVHFFFPTRDSACPLICHLPETLENRRGAVAIKLSLHENPNRRKHVLQRTAERRRTPENATQINCS